MNIGRPKQRVSLSKKMEKDYYVANMKYYLDLAGAYNDKQDTIDNINAANGIVPKDVYGSIMKPLTGGDGTHSNLPGEIRDIDFITPIREKNIGEYLQLPRNFTVKIDDPTTTLLKEREIGDKLRPVIEQLLINTINQQQDTGVPSQEVPDIAKLVEEETDKWFDTRAENAMLLVKAILNDNKMEEKILSLYNDWWSTEEVYVEVREQNGGLFFDEIAPQTGYPIENGNEYVKDHEAFVIKRTITPDVIEERYGDRLTKKDREYLESLNFSVNEPYYSVPTQVFQDYYGRKIMDGIQKTPDGDVIFATGRDIPEFILYYKTEVEREILYYVNQLGEVQQRIIEEDEDFVFDEELGHLEVQKEWIQEVWRQELLGQDDIGIYLKPEPLPIQIYDETGHNQLPIIGKKGILNNLYINPIPKRIIPNLALYRVITLNIERQFAKYKGTVEIIPQGMLNGTDTESARGNMFYRLADNTIIYDEEQIDFNTVAQGYRLVGNDAQTNYIKALIEFREMVKAEAWDMANMNEGRYGMAAPSETVTNNQQNIYNAKLGSMLSITTFNNILVQLYETLLAYAEYLYPDGKSGSLFEDSGDIVYYNIDSGELTANKYGIHMTNSVIDFEKLKQYKDLAFSAGQHGEFGLAAKAIDGESVSSVRKALNEYIELKDNYEKQIKEQEMAQAQQIHQEQMADKQADRDSKMDVMIKEQELITDREIQLESMKVNNQNNNNK